MKLQKIIIAIILLFSLGFYSFASACTKRIVVSSKDWGNQLKYENTSYIICERLDLKGKEFVVPNNSRLVFEGGCLRNGTVRGKETTIQAERILVFENVAVSGSWINKEVYSEWLDFVEGEKVDNARNFENLMLLCAGSKMTHLYMQEGDYYCSVFKESSNIQVPSNVYWHNSATIKQLPTDLQKYALVLIKQVSNVIIDGGEFVGDVQTHNGEKGEWGHGIKVAGGTNIVLKNFVSREFWGDGIDLIEGEYNGTLRAGVGPCKNVTIDNVKCLYNRRQGLSIEAAWNVVVKNSEFAHTGKYKMTKPGCGVDIEPWCANEDKIKDISFLDCNIHDNNPQRDFCLQPNAKYHANNMDVTPPVNRIEIKRCKTGRLFIIGANSVKFDSCDVDGISQYLHGKSIVLSNCKINRKEDIRPRMGLTMKRCK